MIDVANLLTSGIAALVGPSAIFFALLAIGLNIHFGYTGLLNFGQIGFALVGGYGMGIAVLYFGLPLVAAWGGGGFTPRATARVARLMLREGDWEGVRVLGAEGVRQVTRDAGTPGNGGIGFSGSACFSVSR